VRDSITACAGGWREQHGGPPRSVYLHTDDRVDPVFPCHPLATQFRAVDSPKEGRGGHDVAGAEVGRRRPRCARARGRTRGLPRRGGAATDKTWTRLGARHWQKAATATGRQDQASHARATQTGGAAASQEARPSPAAAGANGKTKQHSNRATGRFVPGGGGVLDDPPGAAGLAPKKVVMAGVWRVASSVSPSSSPSLRGRQDHRAHPKNNPSPKRESTPSATKTVSARSPRRRPRADAQAGGARDTERGEPPLPPRARARNVPLNRHRRGRIRQQHPHGTCSTHAAHPHASEAHTRAPRSGPG